MPRPAAATVERTTTVRENIPAEEARSSSMPDFWEYLEALTPEQWDEHLLYIYREEPKVANYGNAPAFLDKCVGQIEVSPGVHVPLSDRGDVEGAIREKFGGRAFRLILKKGRERVSEGKTINEAPPKFPRDIGTGFSFAAAAPGTPTDASAAATIGTRAIDALSGQDSAAIRLAMDVLGKAAEVVRQSAAPQAQNSNPILDRLVSVAVERMVNPPAPPSNPLLERFLGVAIDRLLAPPSTTMPGTSGIVDKLLNAAVDRFMNPPIPEGQRTNMGIELARQIPAVTNALKESVHEWRLGVESQERGVAIARGVPITSPLADVQPSIPANPTVAAAAEPPAASAAAPTMDPPIEWLEHKIVEILNNGELTVGQAADETLSFLALAYPAMITELLTAGPRMIQAGVLPQSKTPVEAGILHLFQTRPILMQVPVNPRLVEFIKTFIAYATPAAPEPAVTEAAPTAPPGA